MKVDDSILTMRKKIFAVSVGIIFIFFWNLFLTPIMMQSLQSNGLTTVGSFIGATITGFIVRQRGWLYGLMVIALVLLVPMVLGGMSLVSMLLMSRTQGIPVHMDESLQAFLSFGGYMIFQVIIPWLIVGAIGGFVGERMSRILPSK